MNSNRTRLVAAIVGAIALSAPVALAIAPTLKFTNLTGSLHVTQGVPCGGVVEANTTIAGGLMEVTPVPSRSDAIGPAQFYLSRLDVLYTPFGVTHSCNGVEATAEFKEIGLRLANTVKFTGVPVSPTRYSFSIPKDQFVIFRSIVDNAPVPQPQTSYTKPSEDVTGEIDLGRKTATLHIALTSRLRFRAGCVGGTCAIDEERDGRQVTEISGISYAPTRDVDHDGVIDLVDNCPLVPNADQSPIASPTITAPPDVTLSSCQGGNIGTAQAQDRCHGRPVAIFNNAPATFAVGVNVVTWSGNDGIDPIVTAEQRVTVTGDTAAPVVSCTAVRPPGNSFQVASTDSCGGGGSLKLGSFTLGNGEVIQIQETGKPGVRLIGTVGPDGIRHFQAGKGEALIVATDAAGNVARAVCR